MLRKVSSHNRSKVAIQFFFYRLYLFNTDCMYPGVPLLSIFSFLMHVVIYLLIPTNICFYALILV